MKHLFRAGNASTRLAIIVGIDHYYFSKNFDYGQSSINALSKSFLELGFDVLRVSNNSISRPNRIQELSASYCSKYSDIFLYFTGLCIVDDGNILLLHPHSKTWKKHSLIDMLKLVTEVKIQYRVANFFFDLAQLNKTTISGLSNRLHANVTICLSNYPNLKTFGGHTWATGNFIQMLQEGPKVFEKMSYITMFTHLQQYAKLLDIHNDFILCDVSKDTDLIFWEQVEVGFLPTKFIADDINSPHEGEREDAIHEVGHFLINSSQPHLKVWAKYSLTMRFYKESAQNVQRIITQFLAKSKPRWQETLNPFQNASFKQDNIPDISLVFIPSGYFYMGNNREEFSQENPLHIVYLDSYRIGKHPITWQFFLMFLDDTDYNYDINHDSKFLECPANYISWYDALAFCKWLTKICHYYGRTDKLEYFTLPTEAEWEKAARGDDGRTYPWGDALIEEHCNHMETNINEITPVSQYSPQGNSPYGCVDMVGNVHEWTLSLWGQGYRRARFKYPYIPNDGREDQEANYSIRRIVRGGAFYFESNCVRCSTRNYKYPQLRHIGGGFRVVLKTLKPEEES